MFDDRKGINFSLDTENRRFGRDDCACGEHWLHSIKAFSIMGARIIYDTHTDLQYLKQICLGSMRTTLSKESLEADAKLARVPWIFLFAK